MYGRLVQWRLCYVQAFFLFMTGTLTTQAAADPAALATLLEQHVRAIASVEHNTATPAALETSARYIEATLAHHGYAVRRHEYTCDGQRVRNIAVLLAPPAPALAPERVIIVGAHYDSAPGAPGANDNGSGAAALLALAERLKTAHIAPGTELQLVFFVNEEPPHFMTECMGSRRHAQQIKAAGLPVEAVLILETIGYYTDAPNSQRYPAGLAALYPSTGNFLGFVSTLGSASLMRRTLAAFRAATSAR